MEKKIKTIEGIGSKIIDLRIKKGISQKQLCSDLKINEGALIRMIKTDTFKDSTLDRVLKYLNGENFDNSNNKVESINNFNLFQGNLIAYFERVIKEKDDVIMRLSTEKGSLLKELGKFSGVSLA